MYQNKRISILHIPIDMLTEDEMDQAVKDLLEEEQSCQICLISYADIMKAQFNREYMDCLRSSRLNIPITTTLTFAAKYLKREKPPISNPFTLVIRLLGVLERNGKSIYILGSRKKNILKSESNLKASFPGLHIVGRYSGKFSQQEEKNIIMAVRKSAPSLLLTGKGLKGNNLWIYRNRNQFPAGLTLWGKTCFEVFSGRKNKPVNSTSGQIVRKSILSIILPWKILSYILFFLFLTIEKIKNR
ncbi:WecB/TagA/CpsF family glycosyltransferase [Oceanispirochaeta sp.]|jgi:N-acetylglucosaminyldiphosphoundecaprenol N-acetyl-beta-D-mannosaminyltransferase|uniref:WecB/TagA/CpsF family glycosyltransferase n=1 Tax=Oceanispirochaeta sp. TaxID=2035350 RepID=UPI002638553D|nr:WecB/TagA/CpsF family glycosyltransferase [Oceanispirochaeta sp.]MDA3955494.1 WecB/TagA/CpsF family glycosyltransferase [Oceanispirochaeta sp.]